MDPHNIDQQLQNNQELFTKLGWQQFIFELKKSRVLSVVRESNYSLSLKLLSIPEILDSEEHQNGTLFLVEMPIAVAFEKQAFIQERRYWLSLVVKQEKRDETHAITKWITSEF